jgi:hypothetical protein
VAILGTTLAVLLWYLASEHQQWLSAPLPRFPAYSSAVLASLVGATAWFNALPATSAFFSWLTTSMLAAMAIAASGALRRA